MKIKNTKKPETANYIKPLYTLLLMVMAGLFTVSLQAQTSTKTLKLYRPPNGNETADSVLLWRKSDSVVCKGAPVGSLNLGGGGNYWSQTGNSGTVASANFIGTADSVDWLIKTNRTERMRITASGNVGIDTTAASRTTLQVTGTPANALKTDGIKAPLITLAQLNAKTYGTAGYGTNQTGALVYVTDVTGGSTVPATANVTGAGYYYFDGTSWFAFAKPTGSVIFSIAMGVTSLSAVESVAANTYTPVSLGLGGAGTIVNIGGGVWNQANYTYTVPLSGTYLLKAIMRMTDATVVPNSGTSRDVYICIGTTLGDQPYGVWTQNSTFVSNTQKRWTDFYMRIAYLNKGDVIQLFTYSSGTTMSLSDASLDIVYLTQNGSATSVN